MSAFNKPAGCNYCVVASPSEQVLATIAGPKPGQAFRLRVEPGQDGYVRLEQLAYCDDLGWYTQKSFCLPGAMLGQLMPHLKLAQCLMPQQAEQPQSGVRMQVEPPRPETQPVLARLKA